MARFRYGFSLVEILNFLGLAAILSAIGMYAQDMEAYRNKPYPVDPKGIEDLS